MNKLLYLLELFLIFHPTAYYRPALETGNMIIVGFFILLNISAVASVKYLFNSFKRRT